MKQDEENEVSLQTSVTVTTTFPSGVATRLYWLHFVGGKDTDKFGDFPVEIL